MYKFKDSDGKEAGLRVWIGFILGFWLAGVRAELCIFLGAIGGLATWYLISAWRAEKGDAPPAKSPAPSPISPLGQVFRQPAERFRKFGLAQRLPKIPGLPRWPARKPRKRL